MISSFTTVRVNVLGDTFKVIGTPMVIGFGLFQEVDRIEAKYLEEKTVLPTEALESTS